MDISSTTPLTFQGDASKAAKCTLTNGEVIFRKAGDISAIAREVNQLQHLVNSSRILTTPQLVSFGDDWLATSWLPGRNLAEQFAMADVEATRSAICERFGSALCASTAISTTQIEPDDPFGQMFDQIDRLVHMNGGRVITDTDSYVNDKTIGDVWREVLSDSSGFVPEIRYVQGDWCLPNVISSDLDTSVLGGIVDWSEAGWLDWRLCIADGLWSIGYNSRLANVNPAEFQRSFLNACEVRSDSDVVVWCRKIRALSALI